jgi:glycosyltransferase involved in cell wall biosynthesis
VNVLHVVPTYVPAWRHGGPILAVHGLCKALAARGHAVTVFTTDVHGDGRLDVPLGEPVAVDGVEVWYFPVRYFPVLSRRLYISPALGSAARTGVRRFDLVHLHSVFLWPTSAAARAAERAGIPYAVSPRGMLVPALMQARGRWRKLAWMRFAERRTLERATALHATSDLEAEEAANLGLSLPPVSVIPNGVDPTPWDGDVETLSPPVRTLLAAGPYALFLGRLSWKKGLDRLIPALAHAPGITLAVAGNDEEDLTAGLEQLAKDSGVAERIAFLGPVHGADKAALLHRALALVLPSQSENFGNVVLESWAAGRPTIVTPEVGLAAAVRETGGGRVIEGDPRRLGEALRDLLARPETAAEMGRKGSLAAAGRFGWGAAAAEMEKVYERMRA